MTNKEQFIAEKMKILVGKENYSRSQAYAIANSYWQKEMQKAQQGGEKQYAQFGLYNGLPLGNAIKQASTQYGVDPMDMQQIMQNQMQSPQQNFDPNYQAYLRNAHTPAQPNNSANQVNQNYNTSSTESNAPSTLSNYTMPPMFSTAYGQTQNVPNQGEKFGSGGYDKSQYSSPTNTEGLAEGYEYDANGDIVEKKKKNQYVTNSVNIVDPTQGFGNPMYNLNRGMYNFGRGNTLGGIAGTGAALFGLARTGLLGYSQGKEDRRIEQEYNEKRFDRTPNYAYGQQGGKIKNSDVIAQNAITDQEGNTNINLEGNEFVMRNNGQVQPVVGEPHIRNGKKADGVDAQLEEGDKVLSNYVKLRPTDIKDLKERYDISLKRGATFAEAQKKLDQKLGIKKLETEKADILEKLEKANKIKDTSTKQLSLEVLSKKTGEVNEKLNTLSGVRASNFEHLFQLQEQQPKKGNGSQLFDKNGKVVEESNEGVAQQGKMINQNDVNRINQNPYMEFTPEGAKQYFEREETNSNGQNSNRTIRNIQGGVSNDKYGDGKYIYYDKLPTEQGFNVNKNREFVTQESYTNSVLNSPEYQAYMQGQKPDRRIAALQQGGNFESIAQKYGISPERARELVMMQSGGEMPQEEEAQQEPTQQGQDPMQQVFQAVAQIIQEGQEDPIAFLMEQGATEEEAQQVVAQVAQQMQGGQEQGQSQGQGSQQELVQMVAEALQSGAQPEEIMQEMVSQGMPEEEAGQAIQVVMQQMQGGQQTAQQGGQKRYAQEAIPPETYEQKMARIIAENVKKGTNAAAPGLWSGSTAEEFYNPYGKWETYLGRTPREIKAHETYQKGITADLNPQISKLITSGEMPLTNKHRQLLKQAGIKNADKIISYTELSEADKKKAGDKFVINGYNDTFAGHRGVVIQPGDKTQEEYEKLTGAYDRLTDKDGRQIYAQYENGKLKRDAKGDFVFYYPKKGDNPPKKTELPKDPLTPEKETAPPYTEQPNQEVEAVNNVKNIPAIFPAFIPPYSPMQAIGKESAFLPRYESIKVTPESMLAEQAAQALNQQYAIEQTGMSPQQQQAVLGRNLAQSQMAANDAISKAEQFNSNNQWQTDNLNTGIRAKEGIMDAQYRQDYQGKILQTLANKETQDYNNYRTNFLQNERDRQYIDQTNKANMLSNQFALVPGQGVIPLDNKPFEFKNDYVALENFLKNATPEEIFAFKKAKGMESAQGSSYNPSTNTEIVNNIYGNKAAIAKSKSKKS